MLIRSPTNGGKVVVCRQMRIPVMPDGYSDMKPDTFACLRVDLIFGGNGV